MLQNEIDGSEVVLFWLFRLLASSRNYTEHCFYCATSSSMLPLFKYYSQEKEFCSWRALWSSRTVHISGISIVEKREMKLNPLCEPRIWSDTLDVGYKFRDIPNSRYD